MSNKSKSVIIAAALAAMGVAAIGFTVDRGKSSGIREIALTRTSTGAVRFTNVDNIALTQGSCKAKVVDAKKGYYLPDPRCTPGAYDPSVTKEVLCSKGFTTKTRRPYSETTNNWEKKIGGAYNFKVNSTFEGDHFIPAWAGGANDVLNFWAEPNSNPVPEPKSPSSNPKDRIESLGRTLVCNGAISVDDFRRAIVNDWTQMHKAMLTDIATQSNRSIPDSRKWSEFRRTTARLADRPE